MVVEAGYLLSNYKLDAGFRHYPAQIMDRTGLAAPGSDAVGNQVAEGGDRGRVEEDLAVNRHALGLARVSVVRYHSASFPESPALPRSPHTIPICALDQAAGESLEYPQDADLAVVTMAVRENRTTECLTH